jgi:hypothetical protein
MALGHTGAHWVRRSFFALLYTIAIQETDSQTIPDARILIVVTSESLSSPITASSLADVHRLGRTSFPGPIRGAPKLLLQVPPQPCLGQYFFSVGPQPFGRNPVRFHVEDAIGDIVKTIGHVSGFLLNLGSTPRTTLFHRLALVR